MCCGSMNRNQLDFSTLCRVFIVKVSFVIVQDFDRVYNTIEIDLHGCMSVCIGFERLLYWH